MITEKASLWSNINIPRVIEYSIVFGVLGAFIVRKAKNGSSSINWPTTEGKVVASEINSRWGGRYSLPGTLWFIKLHYPKVIYEYCVNGKSYTSETLSFFRLEGCHLFYRTAKRFMEQYPPGQVITVYYNPKNPQESTLLTGPTVKFFMLRLLLAILVTLLAIYYLSTHFPR